MPIKTHGISGLFQGAKLRNIIGFPFGNPPLKIGFRNLFEAFRMEAVNLNIDFYGVSSWKPFSPLSKYWVSDNVIGCPGNSVISHPVVLSVLFSLKAGKDKIQCFTPPFIPTMVRQLGKKLNSPVIDHAAGLPTSSSLFKGPNSLVARRHILLK